MLPIRVFILTVFFYIGVILEFSDLAEQKWLKIFPIFYTEIIYGLIHLAWGPVRMVFGWISDKMTQNYPETWSRSHQMSFALCFPIVAWFLITCVLSDADREWIVALLCAAEFGPVILLTVIEMVMVEYIHTEKEAISHSCRRYQLLGKAFGGYAGALVLHWTDVNTVFAIELLLYCGGLLFFLSNVIYVILPTDDGGARESRAERPLPEDPRDVEGEGEVECEITPKDGTADASPIRLVLFMLIYSSVPYARNAFFYYTMGPMNVDMASLGALKVCHVATTIGTTFMYAFVPKQTSFRSVALIGGWIILVASGLRAILSMLIYIPDSLQLAAYFLSVFCMSFGDGIIWTHYVTKCADMPLLKHQYTWLMTLPSFGKMARIALDSSIMLFYEVDHDHFNNVHLVMFVCTITSLTSLAYTLCFIR